MPANIGPKISIDGYSEYRNNMQRILAELAAVEARTNALTAAYKGQTDSLEYLTKKEALQTDALRLQGEAQKLSQEWTDKAVKALEEKAEATSKEQANTAKQVAANERVNASYAQVQSELDETRRAIENYSQGTEEVVEASDNATGRVNAFSVAVGNLISKLIEAGANAAKRFVSMGFSFNSQIETYTAAFSTLLGSEREAANVIQRIQQAAKNAPVFSFESLTKSVQAIAATGKDAETSVGDVLALANAVAAAGGGNDELERMAQNLQQIGNAGKATAMDIRQFAYAGIPLLNLISEATGKTVEEASELEVTYDDVISALKYAASEQGRFYGGLEKQADTLNGQWSRFKNNLAIRSGEVFEGLTEFVKDFLLPLGNAVLESENLNDNIGKIGKGIVTMIAAGKIAQWSSEWTNAAAALKTMAAAVGSGNLAAKLKEEAGIREIIIALLNKQISLTDLVNQKAIAAAGAAGLIGAALSATVGETIKFNKEVKKIATEKLSDVDPGNLDSIRDALKKITPELEKYNKLIQESGDGLYMDASSRTDYAALAEQRAMLLEMERELLAEQQAAATYMESPEGQFDAYINKTKSELEALWTTAEEVYNKARESAQTQFSIFDTVGELAYTSTAEIQQNLQSQTDYWNQYAENLRLVSSEQSGLSTELLAILSDGTAESAALLDSIVKDVNNAGGFASKAGQEILNGLNESWGAVIEAQNQYAVQTEETLVGAAQKTVEIMEELPEALKAFEVPAEMRAAAVTDMNAFKNGLIAQAGNLNAAANNIGANAGRSLTNAFSRAVQGKLSINASGSIIFSAAGSFAKGLDYVPYDEFPAILHKGERVLTAAENRAYNAGQSPSGGNVKNVNYNLYAQTIDNETLEYITAFVDRKLGEMT